MTEAQQILMWLRDNGLTDTDVAQVLGVSRETIYKTRRQYGRYTGVSFLPQLREVARKGGMSGYNKVSSHSARKPYNPNLKGKQMEPTIYQHTAHTSTTVNPVKVQANLKRYQSGKAFQCHKCGYPQYARSTDCYCVSCEQPYQCVR